MKDIAAARRVKVSGDGRGVVSHAGMGLLRELADLTGLSAQVTDVLTDTYKGPWTYAPGAVFADLAAAVADGADCIGRSRAVVRGPRARVRGQGLHDDDVAAGRCAYRRRAPAEDPWRAGGGAGGGLGGRSAQTLASRSVASPPNGSSESSGTSRKPLTSARRLRSTTDQLSAVYARVK